jgi:hypothetical protein
MKMTHYKKSLVLALFCAMLVSLIPASVTAEAPADDPVVKGYVYYGNGVNPVSGPVDAELQDTTQVFQLTEDNIPEQDNGLIQWTDPRFEQDDSVTVTVEKEILGFTLTGSQTFTLSGVNWNVTTFPDILIDHPDAEIRYYDGSWSTTKPFGEGDVVPYEWDDAVQIEDSPGVYGCFDVQIPDVTLLQFKIGFPDAGASTEATYKAVKWNPSGGSYTDIFLQSTNTANNYISVLVGISGPQYRDTCFAIRGSNQNTLPIAVINAEKTTALVDEEIDFDGLDSVDYTNVTGGAGQIVSYAWTFGDGETASGPEVSHAYDEAGTYTVTLTVTDDDGSQDTDTKTITVNEPEEEEEDDEDEVIFSISREWLESETGQACLLIFVVGLIAVIYYYRDRIPGLRR